MASSSQLFIAASSTSTHVSTSTTPSNFSGVVVVYYTSMAPETPPDGQEGVRSLSAVLLAMFAITAFLANGCLFLTIATCHKLRAHFFNHFLLNAAIVNTIDCSVNTIFTLIYLSTGARGWPLGDVLCRVNAFFGLSVLIQSLTALLLLSIDRAVCLFSITKYPTRLNYMRVCILIVSTWIIGLCFTIPILIGSLPTAVSRARHFCTISYGSPLGFAVSTFVICFVLSLLSIFFCFGVIFFRARQDRLSKSQRFRYTSDHIVEARKFKQHLALGKLVVALFILYLLLRGPYVGMYFVDQMRNSKEGMLAYNSRMKLDTDAETAVTWMQLLYPVVWPFIVFGICRDTWRRFVEVLCCRRNTGIGVNGFAVELNDPPNHTNGNGQRHTSTGSDDAETPVLQHRPVPTLVATSGGLHLRGTEGDGETEFYADLKKTTPTPQTRSADEAYNSDDSASWADIAVAGNSTLGVGAARTQVIGNIEKTQLEIDVGGPSFDDDGSLNNLESTAKVISSSQLQLNHQSENEGSLRPPESGKASVASAHHVTPLELTPVRRTSETLPRQKRINRRTRSELPLDASRSSGEFHLPPLQSEPRYGKRITSAVRRALHLDDTDAALNTEDVTAKTETTQLQTSTDRKISSGRSSQIHTTERRSRRSDRLTDRQDRQTDRQTDRHTLQDIQQTVLAQPALEDTIKSVEVEETRSDARQISWLPLNKKETAKAWVN